MRSIERTRGKHDDIVDALGLCGQLMDRFTPGRVPEKPEPIAFNNAYVPRIDDDLWPSFKTL